MERLSGASVCRVQPRQKNDALRTLCFQYKRIRAFHIVTMYILYVFRSTSSSKKTVHISTQLRHIWARSPRVHPQPSHSFWSARRRRLCRVVQHRIRLVNHDAKRVVGDHATALQFCVCHRTGARLALSLLLVKPSLQSQPLVAVAVLGNHRVAHDLLGDRTHERRVPAL